MRRGWSGKNSLPMNQPTKGVMAKLITKAVSWSLASPLLTSWRTLRVTIMG